MRSTEIRYIFFDCHCVLDFNISNDSIRYFFKINLQKSESSIVFCTPFSRSHACLSLIAIHHLNCMTIEYNRNHMISIEYIVSPKKTTIKMTFRHFTYIIHILMTRVKCYKCSFIHNIILPTVTILTVIRSEYLYAQCRPLVAPTAFGTLKSTVQIR